MYQMKVYNVLVFPCGTEIANEIIHALKYNKYFKVKLASSEKMSYCNFRNQHIHFLPYVTNENFLRELKKIVSEENIDFIVPAHDDVAFALSQIEDDIEINIIGQNVKINEIVRFKDKTYAYFKDTLPIADMYEKESDIVFPIFVKPKRGQGSQDSFLIKDQSEFDRFKALYRADDFVWMEYLEGEEFTIDCFSDNGELLYAGGRTREKMTRGISVQSTFVTDSILNEQFQIYADIISRKMQMHGLWFYQMKRDINGSLKLLEIGSRVSGTMMLNRARGVNFVELALFQKLGFSVEVVFNNMEVSLGRALVPKYKTNLEYENLYIDFDDTLFLDESYINADLMKLIFQAKNENKKVYLITKNKKNNLTKALHQFGISHIFDDILHINDTDKKVHYMKQNSLLVDDSFQERKEAIKSGFYAFGNDALDVLI
jgi:hypothetical protein